MQAGRQTQVQSRMDLVSITPTDHVLARYANMIGALCKAHAHEGLARAV